MKDELYNKLNEALLNWDSDNNQDPIDGSDDFIGTLSKNIKNSLNVIFRYKCEGTWVNVFESDIENLLWFPEKTKYFNDQKDMLDAVNNRPIVLNCAKYSWACQDKSETDISFICFGNIQEIEFQNIPALNDIFKKQGVIYFKTLNIWLNESSTTKITVTGSIPKDVTVIHIYDITDFKSGVIGMNQNNQGSYADTLTIDFGKVMKIEGALAIQFLPHSKSQYNKNLKALTFIPSPNVEYYSSQQVTLYDIRKLVVDTTNIHEKLALSINEYSKLESLDDLFTIPGLQGIPEGRLDFYISDISDDLREKFYSCKSRKYPYFKNIFMKRIIENKLEKYKSIEWIIKVDENLSVVYSYYNYYNFNQQSKFQGTLTVSTIKA